MTELETLLEILRVLKSLERIADYTMRAEVGDPDVPRPREPSQPDPGPPR